MASPAASATKQAITPVPGVVNAAVAEMLVMFQNRNVHEQSTIIRERYSPNAIFQDPLMRVKGHKDVALEFYSLIKIFSSVVIQQKDLKVTEGGKEGVYEAALENTQSYTSARKSFFSRHLMPEKVDIEATTTLEIEKESGKIISHTEVWHNKSVPILGFMKPFMGGSTATLFKLLGWGKDVDAKEAASVSPQ